jgi:hypothetical protein
MKYNEVLPSPGGKSEVPAMSPDDAPEMYLPNVGFLPGRLQVSKKKIVTNKIQTLWPFDLSLPKKLMMRGFFPCTVVCFSALLVFLVPAQPRGLSCCLVRVVNTPRITLVTLSIIDVIH